MPGRVGCSRVRLVTDGQTVGRAPTRPRHPRRVRPQWEPGSPDGPAGHADPAGIPVFAPAVSPTPGGPVPARDRATRTR